MGTAATVQVLIQLFPSPFFLLGSACWIGQHIGMWFGRTDRNKEKKNIGLSKKHKGRVGLPTVAALSYYSFPSRSSTYCNFVIQNLG